MLIFFGVALMVVFLLPQLFDPNNFGNAGSASDINQVATVGGKSFNEYELEAERFNHLRTHQVLLEMMQAAFEKQGADVFDQKGTELYERVPIEDLGPEQLNTYSITRMLILREAEEMGMTVSRESTVDYVGFLTSGEFATTGDISAAVREISNGRMDFQQFITQVQQDLTQQKVSTFFEVGVPPVPNISQAYEFYRKLNYRVDCSILAIPVEDELSNVEGSPTNAEMQELFSKGQYAYIDPSNETPGFKVRRKLAVQYFQVKFEDYLNAAMNNVKPEEIETEYKNLCEIKSNLVVKPKGLTDILDGLGDDGSEDPSDENEDENDAPKPPTQDDQSAAEESDESASEGSGEEGSGEESGEGSGNGEGGDQLMSFVSVNRIQESETESAVPAIQEGDSTLDPGLTLEGDATQESEEEEEEVEFYTLAEVAEQIKSSLARRPALEAMEEAIASVESSMIDYSYEYNAWMESQDDPQTDDVEKPEPLDFQALADQYKMVVNEVPLMTDEEFQDDEFGQQLISFTSIGQFGQPIERPVAVWQLVLGRWHELSVYQPETSKAARLSPGVEPDRYIVWVTDKQPPSIPTFEEAKESIVKFWRQQQAAKLAIKKAEKIASELGGQKLVEKYPDTATNTGFFSWLDSTTGSFFIVPGATLVGDDFMSTAFGLEPGTCGVADNLDHSAAYVIQLNEIESENESKMREAFFREYQQLPENLRFQTPELMTAHIRTNQNIGREWVDQLRKKHDVKFISQ